DAADRLLVRGQLEHARHVDAHALDRLDVPRADAVRAVLVDAALQRRPDALPSHLDDAELRDLEHLGPGAVALDRVAQRLLDVPAVLLVAHVDEVVDDDAA